MRSRRLKPRRSNDSRPRKNNPKRRSGNRSKRRVERIDPSKFVRRAQPEAVSEFSPENKFTDFGFARPLQENIAARQFDKPSPIQDQADSACTGR